MNIEYTKLKRHDCGCCESEINEVDSLINIIVDSTIQNVPLELQPTKVCMLIGSLINKLVEKSILNVDDLIDMVAVDAYKYQNPKIKKEDK